MDEELKRALEKGEILTIGDITTETSKKLTAEVLKELDLSDQKILYNFPIGVDFSKHISPSVYLSSLELLQNVLKIPFLSTEYHYEIESLIVLLTQGKINRYHSSLNSTLISLGINLEQSIPEVRKHEIFSHILALLLAINDSPDMVWASLPELSNYFEKKQNDSSYKFQENHTKKYYSDKLLRRYVSTILFEHALAYSINSSQTESWIQIKHQILSCSFSKAAIQIQTLFNEPIIDHLKNIGDSISTKNNRPSEISSKEIITQLKISESIDFFLPEVLMCLWLLLNTP